MRCRPNKVETYIASIIFFIKVLIYMFYGGKTCFNFTLEFDIAIISRRGKL